MRFLIVAFAALSGCVSNIAPTILPTVPGPVDYVENLPPGFSAQQVKSDLEAAIVERFGALALQQGESSEGYVLSQHYQGLPQPTPVGGLPPLPIATLLMLKQSVWYRAQTGGGFSPLTPVQQKQWLAALADKQPWAEPTYANPTCTDSGATYLIVSEPERPFLLRAANCGTPSSERLGLAAINL